MSARGQDAAVKDNETESWFCWLEYDWLSKLFYIVSSLELEK